MRKEQRTEHFARSMWSWNVRHKRTLPWRDLKIDDDTQRAYLVLVSEVMLQQTQVPRVIGAFKQFTQRFPTITDLAAASNKDVVVAWKGMGYNSRALRLRDAAKEIVTKHGGVFPKDYDELLAINGIGPYTAAAIRNFAFDLPTPCVDTNIHRILHRVFIGPEPEKNDRATQKTVLRLAMDTVQGGAEWHAALMDFGSLVCKKSVPRCEACPMAKGICKSAFRIKAVKRAREASKEPGRVIAGRFVPNRIVRGRIVDALREFPDGLPHNDIGAIVAPDWAPEHRAWLDGLLEKLAKDGLVARRGRVFALRD